MISMKTPEEKNAFDPPVYRIEILSREDAQREMKLINAHPDGIRIMSQKAVFMPLKIQGISPFAANVLKQEMLSMGAEAATCAGCIDCSCEKADVILLGTLAHYSRLTEKLKKQPPSLHLLAKKISRITGAEEKPYRFQWKIPGKTFDLEQRILIMGIVNVTPDSFSNGGKYLDTEKAVEHGINMANQGADILDIGGESSRPGSKPVSVDQEKSRVLPVLEKLKGKIHIPVSIDTTKAEVAREAIKRGAVVVNDITALRGDPLMGRVCAESSAGVILMHMLGEPKTMQEKPSYKDVVEDVAAFFGERLEKAQISGIARESIVLDPGIGFGKTLEHNLLLMKNIKVFQDRFERPVAMGISRKRFIGELTGAAVEERLAGTIAASLSCILRGARILRVHDVKACKNALAVWNALF